MEEFITDYSVLDSLLDNISIIDLNGFIRFTNESWIRFAMTNGGNPNKCGIGTNYFDACKEENTVVLGIRQVLTGRILSFQYEYPCHSPSVKRWFLMQTAPLYTSSGEIYGAVISHINITQRKLLELQLEELAITDTLTSLYNRRYFNKKLKQELAHANRYNHSLSLILLDIDHFKKINDTYGHEAGDRAIREISFVLLDCTREKDTCARLGGDEFAIILPETNAKQLKAISERILKEIQNRPLQRNKRYSFTITVSIGALVKGNQKNEEALLHDVDRALYKAKEKGRNQIYMNL
ncbi:sensor domain-containing diguanylate cyclase [Paenibacillus alginolyticus]|uniref:GGDEF domain-containing protein n=2 Tax=Paenibacillus alginolyticus TaxID=59839 RepID=A0ABT4G9J3_9BACL|nr:sensor domain-containing diguanylate cyclase [Paenibacillus alginolyticus]MCY9692849.1 GGDEF domain-containing protein [Paenibacillus alginolyticus]MEC0142906.1 diguanylate cyclase [Paenibacillus alginolyticus]